ARRGSSVADPLRREIRERRHARDLAVSRLDRPVAKRGEEILRTLEGLGMATVEPCRIDRLAKSGGIDGGLARVADDSLAKEGSFGRERREVRPIANERRVERSPPLAPLGLGEARDGSQDEGSYADRVSGVVRDDLARRGLVEKSRVRL